MSGSQGRQGCCITLILSHGLRADSFIFSFHSHSFSLLLLFFLLSLCTPTSVLHIFPFVSRCQSFSPTLGKSASVFHMQPLLNILCHGARFPVFENNPSSCIINLERACQSTWYSATPHPLLPSPGTF